MHFTLSPAPTFVADAHISVPGQVERAKIEFTFRHKGRRALNDWTARVDKRSGQAPDLDVDLALISEVAAGWRGPQTADGAPLPFSQQNLAELLDAYPGAFIELVGAYVRGLVSAREKN